MTDTPPPVERGDEPTTESTATPTGVASGPDFSGGAGTQAPAVKQSESSTPIVAPLEAPKRTLYDKLEAFISRLSTRNNFWHRVISFIYLPYAFRSGIRMLNRDEAGAEDGPFEAMLPFRPFNKNWYNAMAGASLLGASEVAGGMALFKTVGSDYRVVCKELEYRFLRPCIGPAVYRVEPQEDVEALVANGGPFNIKVKINILQGLTTPGEREKRVGRCFATFHVSPKVEHAAKKAAGRAV